MLGVEEAQWDISSVELYNWGDCTHSCLFYEKNPTRMSLYHSDSSSQTLPIKAEDFDPKFDIRTFQMLKNRSSIIFDLDGRIYAFGKNSCGQLGHGSVDVVPHPKRIEAFLKENIIMVSGSSGLDDEHTLFLNDAHTVFACGNNDDWQAIGCECDKVVGEVLELPILLPRQVALPEDDICSISTGYCFSGVLNASNATILCWGGNFVGECITAV